MLEARVSLCTANAAAANKREFTAKQAKQNAFVRPHSAIPQHNLFDSNRVARPCSAVINVTTHYEPRHAVSRPGWKLQHRQQILDTCFPKRHAPINIQMPHESPRGSSESPTSLHARRMKELDHEAKLHSSQDLAAQDTDAMWAELLAVAHSKELEKKMEGASMEVMCRVAHSKNEMNLGKANVEVMFRHPQQRNEQPAVRMKDLLEQEIGLLRAASVQNQQASMQHNRNRYAPQAAPLIRPRCAINAVEHPAQNTQWPGPMPNPSVHSALPPHSKDAMLRRVMKKQRTQVKRERSNPNVRPNRRSAHTRAFGLNATI